MIKLDEKGKAEVIDASKASDDKLMEIAESCPLNAIIIEDDQGNILFP